MPPNFLFHIFAQAKLCGPGLEWQTTNSNLQQFMEIMQSVGTQPSRVLSVWPSPGFFFAEVLIVVIVAVAAWLRNRCKLSINQKNAPISQSRWGNSRQSPYTCRLPCYIYRIESSPFLSITFYDKLIKHELRTLATTGEMGKYDHFESI